MLWHQSLIKQALLISLLTSTFKTRCFQTDFISRLSFQRFFFTPNKRHLNPPDNNCDPSMFKKEMFPRVKQKPAIPEDYFSLSLHRLVSTQLSLHSALYTGQYHYRAQQIFVAPETKIASGNENLRDERDCHSITLRYRLCDISVFSFVLLCVIT